MPRSPYLFMCFLSRFRNICDVLSFTRLKANFVGQYTCIYMYIHVRLCVLYSNNYDCIFMCIRMNVFYFALFFP